MVVGDMPPSLQMLKKLFRSKVISSVNHYWKSPIIISLYSVSSVANFFNLKFMFGSEWINGRLIKCPQA